jgi:hypothetical protein
MGFVKGNEIECYERTKQTPELMQRQITLPGQRKLVYGHRHRKTFVGNLSHTYLTADSSAGGCKDEYMLNKSSSVDSIIASDPVNDGFWDEKTGKEKLLEMKSGIVDGFWD